MENQSKKRGRKPIDPKQRLMTINVPVRAYIVEAVGGEKTAKAILRSMAENLMKPKEE